MKITVKLAGFLLLSVFCNLSIINTSSAAGVGLVKIGPELMNEINGHPTSPAAYEATLAKVPISKPVEAFSLSVKLFEEEKFKESIDQLLIVNEMFPDAPYLMWRLSRGYWVYGEDLDINDKENRLSNFQIGLDWAEKGIARDPKCAGCYMFKFANLGRIGTTKGILSQISTAKELSEIIAKTIALNPQHQDTPFNNTLGNAYYGSGVFYRIVPDWFIIKLIAGVRGDKMKALEHIKKATEIIPTRIDYQIELGAVYLCLANDKGMEEMREKGIKVLKHSLTMKENMPTDKIDKDYAQGFLDDSSGACGFSRDGIVDLDKKKLDEAK